MYSSCFPLGLLLSSQSYSITFYLSLLFIPINFICSSLFCYLFSTFILISTPFLYSELAFLSPLKLCLRKCHRIRLCFALLTLFSIKSLICSFNYIAKDLPTNWFGMWIHSSGDRAKYGRWKASNGGKKANKTTWNSRLFISRAV